MAPYAVCHLKLAQELAGPEAGFELPGGCGLNVFLTNTLEEPHEVSQGQIALMSHAIAQESTKADAVKRDHPVMVILGNPPYSGHSANKGEWIKNLLRGKDGTETTGNYFEVDGSPLKERNMKWVSDDYVKFIRYAQRRIERTREGILGFVTNHGYLDSPTFRGMRQSLLETFDHIYVLDLHGNTKKRERSPDGGKDENVFDIQQGVAIGLFVKFKQADQGPAKVYHSDVFGERGSGNSGKYPWLAANDVTTTKWTELTPKPPHFLFIPHDEGLTEEYYAGWSIPKVFPINSVGVTTARDKFAIHFSEDRVSKLIGEFVDLNPEDARMIYQLGKDTDDWKVSLAQNDIKNSGTSLELIKSILYRPFDTRYTYYSGNNRGFICRTRKNVMHHMLAGPNYGLATSRGTEIARGWEHVFVSKGLMQLHAVSTKETNYLFPLYNYPTEAQENIGQVREPNISAEFTESVSNVLGLEFTTAEYGDLRTTVGPNDLFNYIYAVLHSPDYRQRYADFLKSDFARVPLTTNLDLFTELTALGQRMKTLHLMESAADSMPSYPQTGTNQVDKVRYLSPKGEELGRVYINKDQYFEGVSPETWDFHIGGTRPADKWLKDRKGRALTFDDIGHYRQICAVLSESRELMAQIDRTIEAHGGWPLQ